MSDEHDLSREQLAEALRQARGRIRELEEGHAEVCLQEQAEIRIFNWILNPMVCLVHENGGLFFSQVNEPFAVFAEQSADFLVGKRLGEVLPAPELERLLCEALEKGQPLRKKAWRFEHRSRGATFWDLSLLPLENDSPPGSWLVLCLVDVTEHIRTKEALSRGEQNLRALINAVPDIVCFKDGQGRWLEANDADLELFGLKGVDYHGKTDSQLADDTLPLFREAFLTCEQTDENAWLKGVISRVEEAIPLADGGAKVYDVIKVPLFDDAGGRKGLVVVGRDITERKAAEKALRESEALHALVLAGVNDGIWDWDRKTDEVFYSSRWKEIIGYKDHEIENILEEWISRIHPEDKERVLEAYDSLFYNDADLFEAEYRLRHKDGGYRWILGRGACLRGEDGQPRRMAGAHTDITEFKRVEEQLRRSMRHFRALFDNATMGIVLHELVKDQSGNPVDYRVLNVNASFCTIFEIEKERAQNHLASEVYDLGEPPFLEAFARVVRTGEPTLFDAYYAPLDRHFRIVAFSTGENSFASIIEDISKAKEAEAQLHEALHKLAFHVDNSPLAVIDWKDGTHIAGWSSSAETMFGWRAHEVLGKTWGDFDFVHPEDVPDVQARLERLFQGRDVYNISKNRNLRKNGEVIHCQWFNSALRDDSGRMISILSQVADMTELVETTRRFQKAKDAAEAANLAKSQFLATMSHEIRTPMNVITGMAEMFKETSLSQEQRQYLNILETASNSLLTLLGDILDISKVEAGQLELERIAFKVQDVLDTILEVLGPRAAEKGLELAVELDPAVPEMLVGDPNRVRQVLTNLVSNAIKFTPSGDVRIFLAPDHDAAVSSGFAMRCSVRDTGIGIKDEKLEAIFEQFTQGDSSITRNYGGSGLGLAICKSLVHLMRGRLWAESAPGKGSTFHFTAVFETYTPESPLQRVPELPRAEVAGTGLSEAPDEEPRVQAGHGLKLLLVEDSDYNAYVVLAFLKNVDCSVDIAKNGKQGLELFKSKTYDLVLMDIRMPVMDGYTASKAMRQWEQERGAPRTPIIAMTAQAFKEDRQRSLDAGCDLHLPKPIRRQELLDIVLGLTPREHGAGRGESEATGAAAKDAGAVSGTAKDAPLPKEPDDDLAYPAQGPIFVSMDPELTNVVPRYLFFLKKSMVELRGKLGVGDVQAAARAGHRMKGEGRAYGFAPVSVYGASLQEAGLAGDMERALELLDKLEDYLNRVELL